MVYDRIKLLTLNSHKYVDFHWLEVYQVTFWDKCFYLRCNHDLVLFNNLMERTYSTHNRNWNQFVITLYSFTIQKPKKKRSIYIINYEMCNQCNKFWEYNNLWWRNHYLKVSNYRSLAAILKGLTHTQRHSLRDIGGCTAMDSPSWDNRVLNANIM
jgi:hypothetical protein